MGAGGLSQIIEAYTDSDGQPKFVSGPLGVPNASAYPPLADYAGGYADASAKYGQPVDPEKAAMQASALPDSEERVRFVHIGKTGGGSIEAAALRHGHLWGEEQLWPHLPDDVMPCVRTNPIGGVFGGHSYHHVPPCFWATQRLDPYQLQTPRFLRTSFCIVRHPYSRAVSAYSYRLRKLPMHVYCNREGLNEWVRARLQLMISNRRRLQTCDLNNETGVDDCHWLPQTLYTPECDSVLRFEDLRDLDTLPNPIVDPLHSRRMDGNESGSGLDVNFDKYTAILASEGYVASPFGLSEPKSGTKASSATQNIDHESSCKLTYQDLSQETRFLLDDVYADDFRVLLYNSLSVSDSGPLVARR